MKVPSTSCSQYVTTFTTTNTTTGMPLAPLPPPETEASSWTGNPRDWGVFQWSVLAVPLVAVSIVFYYVFYSRSKSRARQLQRVYVSPVPLASKDGDKIEWDLGQAGTLTLQELNKTAEALAEAEKADGPKGPQPRHLAFASCNGLSALHLGVIGAILDRHARVSISIDTDWQRADDACLKSLVVLLRRRERCEFRALDIVDGYGGLATLRLPSNAQPDTVEALIDAMPASCHPEVDAISFFPTGFSAPGRMATTIHLSPLRLSCQELVIRRSLLGHLGTIAICAFVRPYANRIQCVRLEDCQITDEGVTALARIFGSNLKDLCHQLSSRFCGNPRLPKQLFMLGCSQSRQEPLG
jgi:hypothetical protein